MSRTLTLAGLVLSLLFPPPLTAQVLVGPEAASDQPERAEADVPEGLERAELVLDTQGFSSGVASLAFSPDGRLLAAAAEKEVRIWDLETGTLRITLRGQRQRDSYGNCYAVAFSPDGRELVVGIDDYTDAGSIRVFDTADWDEIKELVAGHRVAVRKLAFSRDGRYLASAGSNGKIFVWDWPARRRLHVIEPEQADQPLYVFMEFPTTEPLLAVGRQSGSISVFSAPDARELGPRDRVPNELLHWLTSFHRAQYPFGGTGPRELTLPLDAGVWLAGGSSRQDGRSRYWVGIWKGEAMTPVRVYERHRWTVTAVAHSVQGDLAASADQFGEIHVWETATASRRHLFRSLGRPVYEVAFDQTANRLRFGTRPFGAQQWGHNSYGAADQVFDLDQRTVATLPQPMPPAARTVLGARSLKAERTTDGTHYVVCSRQGRVESRFRVRSGAEPRCFGFLSSSRLGIDPLVVLGDDGGVLFCYDPQTDERRRDFIGHTSNVTAFDESPDGRLLVSGSADRTLRFWSLQDYRPTGEFDFRQLEDLVLEVRKNSPAERLGVRAGDRIRSLDGLNLTEIYKLKLDARFPYLPGDRVPVVLERSGRPYQVDMTLREGADVSEPLLNVFLTETGEWVIWTPQGYYDASPGADRYIGWHVNRGPEKSARFYRAQQFRRHLYRPDIIDEILRTGRVAEAVEAANASRPRREEAIDLRAVSAIRDIEPPEVRILEPRDGAQVSGSAVTVRAAVRASNDLAVREITVLVNGRPAERLRPPFDGEGEHVVEQEISVPPGRSQVAVVASNEASTSEPQSVAVVHRPAEPVRNLKPDLYALAIGISQYRQADLNLQYAAHDAGEFIRMVERQQGGLYERVETRLLTDADATRTGILDGLAWLLSQATENDVAMLFVSAHGFRDAQRDYYLSTHDVDPSPRGLFSTAVPYSEVKRALERFPCNVVLFADTCHAGGITGAKGAPDPLQDLVAPEVGVVVFASSSPRQESLEDQAWGHGAFTRALLDTASSPDSDRDDPQDGRLSLAELQFNLARRVRDLTNGQQHPVSQVPPTVPDFDVLKIVP